MTITVNQKNQPTSFVGEDAVDIFRIRTLKSALGLFKAGIRPTRTQIAQALHLATQYTGKKYKRTQIEQAMHDLDKIAQIRLQHVEIKHD